MRRVIFSTMAALCWPWLASGEELKAGAAKGEIKIDGRLDEPSWASAAAWSGFSKLKSQNLDGSALMSDTEVRTIVDADNVYVGIRCAEPMMDKLRANVTAFNDNVWRDDCVEIFLSPAASPTKYYQFAVAAGGAGWNQYWEEKGAVRPDPYGPKWEWAAHKDKDFWSVECRLPLAAFYMTPTSEWKNTWRMNVTRSRTPVGEVSSWAEMRLSFHEPADFRAVAGFPSKARERDASIRGVKANVRRLDADGGASGDLVVTVNSAFSGKCQLVMDGARPVAASLAPGVNNITAPEVKFKKTGRIAINGKLLDSSGKVLNDRSYPATAEYTPASMTLDSPFYGKAFFHGQKSDRIKGSVKLNLDAADMEKCEVELSMSGDGMKPSSKKAAPQNGEVPFDFDAAEMTTGKAELKAVVSVGGRKACELQETIRKLPPGPAETVWIEKPGRLVLNGKPVFFLGWYNDFWLVSQMYRERYPDSRARTPQANMLPWVSIEPNRLSPNLEEREATHDITPSEEVLKRLSEIVAESKSRKFHFYYLCDEPAYRNISPVYLRHIYEKVKELDPYHPVMIVDVNPDKYIDCADVINMHPYFGPTLNDKGERVISGGLEGAMNCFDAYHRAAEGKNGKAVMMMPQAFTYRYMNIYGEFPTFDEMHANMFSGIARGAQGLQPFIYYDYVARPELMIGVDHIFESAALLSDYLTCGEQLKASTGNPLAVARLLRVGDEHLLMIVNMSAKKEAVNLTSDLPSKTKSMDKFREPGAVSIDNGKFSMTMEPRQVLILSTKKLDSGVRQLSETRAEIAAADRARADRGNLLFGKEKRVDVAVGNPVYVAFNSLGAQDKLFDGVTDQLAWKPASGAEKHIEIGFKKFVPEFTRMVVHGHAMENMGIKMWKEGKWVRPEVKNTKSERFKTEVEFATPLRTVKLRVDFPLENRELEVYEIELLK